MTVGKLSDIIAFGSCYVDTNTSHFPFDSAGIPVETELVGKDYTVMPGGSAVTFCLQLKELGLNPAFIGMTGEDENGRTLASLLAQKGVAVELIKRPGLQTNISFNMTNDTGNNIQLVAGTANAALHPDHVLPKLDELLRHTTFLYLGGCFKLKAFTSSFAEVAQLAKQHNASIVVDHNRIPKDTSEQLREAVKKLVLNASYYLPSRDEFCELWEVASIEEGLRLLQREAPQLIVIVKDGENGAHYLENKTSIRVPAEKLEHVTQVTGAGDTFNAAVITAIIKGATIATATSYGCKVAAAKITNSPLPLLESETTQ